MTASSSISFVHMKRRKKDETHIINQQCRRRRLKGDTHNVVIFHEKNSSVAQRRRQDREKVLVMMISLRRRVVRRWSRRGDADRIWHWFRFFLKRGNKKKVYFFPHPFSPSTRSPMFLKWPFSFWYISTARLRTGVCEQQRILVEKKKCRDTNVFVVGHNKKRNTFLFLLLRIIRYEETIKYLFRGHYILQSLVFHLLLLMKCNESTCSII